MAKTPSYRPRTGYSQAIVTLTDSATGKRRDYWLGEFGTPASREMYHRLVAEWEGNGRRLPGASPPPLVASTPHYRPSLPPRVRRGGAVAAVGRALIRAYWGWAKGYYAGASTCCVKMALRVLRECYGTADAGWFGPNALRIVRESMVRGSPEGPRPRQPLCRRTANARVGHIIRMYRWAASREMVPAQVYQALQTLPPLKRGRCGAVEHPPVGPVTQEAVDAVKPFVSRQVAALIDLQLLTGARPGELLALRAAELDTSDGEVWCYRPRDHKNEHRGIERVIRFGPKARAVLAPFLADRPLDAYLFSPAEAERERRAALHARRVTPRSCGNAPGTNTSDSPAHAPGDRYTTPSYRRAIERACDAAFPPPEHLRVRTLPKGQRGPARKETELELLARLTPNQRAELKAWRESHRWHPNQLRHAAATRIRREFGIEAAQILLGHSSAALTDAVYAERDSEKLGEVLKRVG